ncbi:Na(+) H(+) antiporter subunit C [Fulvivirga imtechensis AK7]|uniref:Na(+) H(+) antiporter subunit C n=1 Tax=Fulvivirga imtechensis AK7 TaxID=1237149 RepID=L8JQG0_9BACT|nr:Na+/H+ antiporter subunit C [Fulvivirga imtechensis]ELR70448.1 Na(+) H(+) antiporter subunit C [Fulvivirga imtechensis AK7]
MEVILAISIGLLYAISVYLLLRRSIVKLILGIMFLSNATNLLVFTAGGLTHGKPAFIEQEQQTPPENIADPLPQALILTAIVIGFGLIAFTLVLTYKYHSVSGTEDLDQVKETDKFE